MTEQDFRPGLEDVPAAKSAVSFIDGKRARLEYRGIEQWDSLAHLTLVAQIEDTFEVMIDTDEVIDLSSFDKAVEILGKHDVALAR